MKAYFFKSFSSFSKISYSSSKLPQRNVLQLVNTLDHINNLPSAQLVDLKDDKVTLVYQPEQTVLRQAVSLIDDNSHDKLSKTVSKALGSISAVDKESPLELVFDNFSTESKKKLLSLVIAANYNYSQKTDKKPINIDTLLVRESDKTVQMELNLATTIENAVSYTRDLANGRAESHNPDFFEKEAKIVAKKAKVKVESIVGEQLLKKNLNLLHSVGKAAPSQPRLVNLTYFGRGGKEVDVALVGKGITFDTGGLNLKGMDNMLNMHVDKHGACSALASFKALVELGVKKNIVCSLALAENSIDANSYRPSDILTSLKGLTVEINNTDAEGRLVLADAFTYVQNKYKPATLIDFATLTGAAAVALGNETAAVFSNNDDLAADFIKTGKLFGNQRRRRTDVETTFIGRKYERPR